MASTTSKKAMSPQEEEPTNFDYDVDWNTKLSDQVSILVRKHMTPQLNALPLLSDPRKTKLLEDKLLQSYDRNIDLLEIYSQRNIMSTALLPTKRQERIREILTQETIRNEELRRDIEEARQSIEENELKLESLPGAFSSISEEQAKNMPTADDLQTLLTQTQEIISKLQKVQLKKAERQAQKAQEVEVAHQLATLSSGILSASSLALPPLAQHEQLQALQQQGTQLLEELQIEKRQRGDDENEVNDLSSPPRKKGANMTLQERYQQNVQRFVLGNTTNNRGATDQPLETIQNIQRLLKLSK